VADRSGPESFAIAVGMLFVTIFLHSWLSRLKDKSDGHRDDALALYARLGVALKRDAEHRHSRRRLWGPFIAFPWATLGALWMWILGANVPALCVLAR
jgi:hypothetical protein